MSECTAAELSAYDVVIFSSDFSFNFFYFFFIAIFLLSFLWLSEAEFESKTLYTGVLQRLEYSDMCICISIIVSPPGGRTITLDYQFERGE